MIAGCRLGFHAQREPAWSLESVCQLANPTVATRLAPLTSNSSRHVVIDSTGVKVYGEGEWKARKHGVSKRRTWLKLHVGIDEETGEILAAVVTPNSTGDSEVLGELLDEIDDEIEQVSADGAYDCGYVYDYIEERDATAAIPPRKDAKI